MDGFQRSVSRSLQFRLSVWVSVVILGIAIAAGVLSFAFAFHEANELQDDQLQQTATLLHRYRTPHGEVVILPEPPESDPESQIVIQALSNGDPADQEARNTQLPWPTSLPDGMQTVSLHGDTWRVFVANPEVGPRIAVGQRTAVRDEIARDSALSTLLPLVALIPVLLILVGVLIRQMLKPIKRLASEVNRRPEHDLTALNDAGVPSEIRPFISAINQLLFRVERSMALQRRFIADAAHELRSPLTALSLQAELLSAADMSAIATQRLEILQHGLGRSRSLLEQLLALYRAQESSGGMVENVSLGEVFQEVLEDLIPLAEDKHIDVGVVGDARAEILAARMDLKILVKNIVENAVRYTPQGGRVDLSIQKADGHVMLQVDDTGPGIAKEDRGRVFDPFYRVLGNGETGSGLGLSIVQAIAARMGAEVTLDSSTGKGLAPGLRVRVVFPRAMTPSS